MNKIIFKGFMAVLVIGLSVQWNSQASATSKMDSDVDYSDQINSYVTKTNLKTVQYLDGKVSFFSDVSNLGLAVLGTISVASMAVSGVCVMFGGKDFILPTIVLGAFGIGAGAIILNKVRRKCSHIPYIIFDREGLTCDGKFMFKWRAVERVHIVQQMLNGMGDSGVVGYDVYFLDNNDKSLFELTGDFKSLSPKSLVHLLALTELYRNQAFGLPADTQFATIEQVRRR